MSNICTACGMCCDGTLFSYVPIAADDDLTPLREKHAVFESREQGDSFRQPCSALESRCCTIYAVRPSACRAYRCKLLEKVEAGETDVGTARDIIATAIRLRDEVRPKIEALVASPDEMSVRKSLSWIYRTLSEEGDNTPLGEDRVALRLDVAALHIVLTTHFEDEPAPPVAVAGAVEPRSPRSGGIKRDEIGVGTASAGPNLDARPELMPVAGSSRRSRSSPTGRSSPRSQSRCPSG